MPRTVEHITAMHQLATERRNSGRPVWAGKVNLSGFFHDSSLSIEEKAQKTAAAFRASAWVRNADEYEQIHDLLDYLDGVDTVAEFNGVLDDIYDEADHARVWVITR